MIISLTVIITEAILLIEESQFIELFMSLSFSMHWNIFLYIFSKEEFFGWWAAKMEERKGHQDHKKHRRYA